MLTWFKELLWDKTAARTLFLGAIALSGAYYNTPTNRPWHERLAGAAVVAFTTGAAAASWRPSNGRGK